MPAASAPREYEASSLAGPAILHAFYRPSMASPDALPLEVIRCRAMTFLELQGRRTSRPVIACDWPGLEVSADCEGLQQTPEVS